MLSSHIHLYSKRYRLIFTSCALHYCYAVCVVQLAYIALLASFIFLRKQMKYYFITVLSMCMYLGITPFQIFDQLLSECSL